MITCRGCGKELENCTCDVLTKTYEEKIANLEARIKELIPTRKELIYLSAATKYYPYYENIQGQVLAKLQKIANLQEVNNG